MQKKLGRNGQEWIKFKNKTNLKCYDNTNVITIAFSILVKFNIIHVYITTTRSNNVLKRT